MENCRPDHGYTHDRFVVCHCLINVSTAMNGLPVMVAEKSHLEVEQVFCGLEHFEYSLLCRVIPMRPTSHGLKICIICSCNFYLH